PAISAIVAQPEIVTAPAAHKLRTNFLFINMGHLNR
ncbi:hypothetical protein J789_3719, partial [Acinetobacter baumannii 44895_6]